MSSNEAFKALADPTRREILALLRQGEMTAGALAEKFDMTKPSMSHHFAVLKEADLITSRREGQQIWYGLNTTVVQDLMAWAMDLAGGPKARGANKNDKQVQLVSAAADRGGVRGNRRGISPSSKPRRYALEYQPQAKRL
jgi:ArsR family transcriptional regulator, arsenate/arsenite/antimonite-responsive transcriptional repressor